MVKGIYISPGQDTLFDMTTLPVSPVLLHSTDVPPASPGWVHQVKFDGVRCVLASVDGAVNLWSRHGTPYTRQFPEFQSLHLPQSVILDGEIIVVSSGWTDFDAVMELFMSKREDKIVRLAATTPAHFVAFDILNINGDSVMSRPLRERQALLSSVVGPSDVISVCQSFEDGQALFESTRQLEWEGIVSKRLESPYRPGVRSKDWVKAKHYRGSNGRGSDTSRALRLPGRTRGSNGWHGGACSGVRVSRGKSANVRLTGDG